MSGRSRQYAEVAVAVDAWSRHQSGKAVDQFQWSEKQRTLLARTGLGALVETVLAIEFVQPFQGERGPGAIAQKTLTPRAVSGLDGAAICRSTIDRKAKAYAYPRRRSARGRLL